MVHPYLRRARGARSRTIHAPNCARCWRRRWACRSSRTGDEGRDRRAGFTAVEADQLRRAMATFKFTGGVSHFYDKLVEGMVSRGYPRDSPNGPSSRSRASAPMVPRKPRRLLRQDRVRQLLDEALSSRRVLRRSAERPADGFLRPRSGRPRCARGMASRYGQPASTPAAGTVRWNDPRPLYRRAARTAPSARPCQCAWCGDRRGAGRRPFPVGRRGVAACGVPRARSSDWPKRMPSMRWARIAVRGYGR